jgi:ring-1,2-phenylacetyl-CoA epoxidase subunit PaaE
MIEVVTGVLKEKKESAIKFELFTASSHENVIQDLEGHTKITVMVDDEETTLKCLKTLLEAALKQGLDAPYSCQGGICSSCLARVTSGTAEMAKNSILTDGEIASGLVLTAKRILRQKQYMWIMMMF